LHDAQTNLFEIALATGATRIFTGTGEHREQNCAGLLCRYDDKQFNQGKSAFAVLRDGEG
jgi:hypothetical protein